MANYSDSWKWTNYTYYYDFLNFSVWEVQFYEYSNLTSERPAYSSDSSTGTLEEKIRLILPYTFILLLAVVGNVLVIVTLAVNKRMRTVTNVFLLNLSVSDLLLGVFCMPFTLVGVLMREFIFGDVMCRLIPYLQAVSVSVSAWTLVSMSVERYYAICHPLKSREWQTLSHAYRMIGAVWVGSILCMLPIAVLSELQPLRGIDRFKCRENWPSKATEKLFNIFLDALLLVTPLLIMVITYLLITITLWRAMRPLRYRTEGKTNRFLLQLTSNNTFRVRQDLGERDFYAIHSVNNHKKALAQKKRVIKMLFVVVLEFFICWTPIHVINTVSFFNPTAVYGGLGYHGISFFQLLAYTSSCCNPITYCFMNSNFRKSFLNIFGCKCTGWHVQFSGSISGTFRTPVNHTGVSNRVLSTI
ncbi:cholecystokinin receptor-like [Tachypleus tridentatus]|uniref:cholecystokinin receptor-like n=1 Tax=Tachypleus tridentatus TaxID=6853 RepID=UPI003FD5F41F